MSSSLNAHHLKVELLILLDNYRIRATILFSSESDLFYQKSQESLPISTTLGYLVDTISEDRFDFVGLLVGKGSAGDLAVVFESLVDREDVAEDHHRH